MKWFHTYVRSELCLHHVHTCSTTLLQPKPLQNFSSLLLFGQFSYDVSFWTINFQDFFQGFRKKNSIIALKAFFFSCVFCKVPFRFLCSFPSVSEFIFIALFLARAKLYSFPTVHPPYSGQNLNRITIKNCFTSPERILEKMKDTRK